MEQRMKQAIWPRVLSRIQAAAGKYKVPILVLMLGALLLLLPSGGKTEGRAQAAPDAGTELTDLQTQLQALLEQVDGVGRVELLLRAAGSGETIYQLDTRTSENSTENTTVFSSAQSEKTPVVTQVRYATFTGAVVVCDGAGSASVRLRVTQAVSSLTGLGSDKITVIKMKQQ